MFQRTILRSELEGRLDIYERDQTSASRVSSCGDGMYSSLKWIRNLLNALSLLDGRQKSVAEIKTEYFRLLCDESDRRRWELARIPVLWTFCEEQLNYGTHFAREIGIWVGSRFCRIGSEHCPFDVFYASEHKQIRHQDKHWCFYDFDLAAKLGIEVVKTWSVSDSIVDWVISWMHRSDIRVEIGKYGSEFAYVLTNEPRVSVREKVLSFIQKHGPVSTQQIQQQHFGHERQIYKILRQLVFADKIEKVKHGYYKSL